MTAHPSIVGIGTDIVAVRRLAALIDRGGERFLGRWFHPSEIDGLAEESVAREVAALLAAKEATAKALRVPADGAVAWLDVEVTPGPGITLHGRLAALGTQRGVDVFHVSMAHAPEHAIATVLALSSRVRPRSDVG